MGIRQKTLDFIEGSRTAASADQLLEETLNFCSEFNIDGVFVADVPDPGENIAAHILLKGWNPNWIERYVENGYVHLDPVARALKTRVGPYLWSEVCDRRLEHHETLVMGEAAEHGLTSGISVPLLDIEGRQSCVSFSGHKLTLDNESRGSIHMVAIYTHARLRELRRDKNIRLTARERECLAWASFGKSAWETGRILDISPETAQEYLTDACRKIGVRSKTQAVAAALRIGLIS